MTTASESLHQRFQSSDPSLDVQAMVAWLDRVDALPLGQPRFHRHRSETLTMNRPSAFSGT